MTRERESRKVGIDARITFPGTAYEVEPDMAGESVVILWGLFDDEMVVEFDGEKFDTKPAEIKALFSNSLDATRAAELRSQFLAAGLPI